MNDNTQLITNDFVVGHQYKLNIPLIHDEGLQQFARYFGGLHTPILLLWFDCEQGGIFCKADANPQFTERALSPTLTRLDERDAHLKMLMTIMVGDYGMDINSMHNPIINARIDNSHSIVRGSRLLPYDKPRNKKSMWAISPPRYVFHEDV